MFTPKFLVHFCDNICRDHTVLAKSKEKEAQYILRKKYSVSLEKDLIFQIDIYFSASFAFHFLGSYTKSQTGMMVPFNIETLNFGVVLLVFMPFYSFSIF